MAHRTQRNPRRIRAAVCLMALTLTVVSLTGCAGPKSDSTNGGTAKAAGTKKITLVSYAVTSEAYSKIIPAFQKYWKDKTGENVEFEESYGGSGSQSRAVIDGLEADVVHLAMEPDVAKIEEAGLIDAGWQTEAAGNAIPSTSLIVAGVRSGNPKAIADWADIAKSGIEVVTPDPKTSGGARWNVLAAWGSVTQNGGSEDEAFGLLVKIFKNTSVLDKNARDATNTFTKKKIGDAALLWESDALVAQNEGEKFDIVYPANTILAETAAAVVDANAKDKGNEEVAKAFVDFLFTPEAQEAFAETGLRPVDETVLAKYSTKYPQPSAKQYSIGDFGGWADAQPKFFDEGGIYDKVQSEVTGAK